MSKGYLTTHVLDTYNGKPGSGIKGSIYFFEDSNQKKITDFILNADGRCDQPILENNLFKIGKYEIKFYCGEYFTKFTFIIIYLAGSQSEQTTFREKKENFTTT